MDAGENNLKMRKALVETADLICNNTDEEDAEGYPVLMLKPHDGERDAVWRDFDGRVECDLPNGDLDRFNGRIFFKDGPLKNKTDLFLEKDNLLLRGTQLRNCAGVYGLAVYTGYECKINFGASADSAEKIPSISAHIDRFVLLMFAFQVLLCVIGASGYVIWNVTNAESIWYITGLASDGAERAGSWFLSFFTFFLLTSNLVPISLYVSIKMSRQAQKFIMDRDRDMAVVQRGAKWRTGLRCCRCNKNEEAFHDEEAMEFAPGTKPEVLNTEVRTMELNDELGQITHIFSDKTGTMTCNDFKFRQISVNGKIYGRATTQIGVIAARARATSPEEKQQVANLEQLLEQGDQVENGVEKVRFLDDPGQSVWDALADPKEELQLRYFMYNLALNHTVELEPVGDDIKYSSASPDEEAFAYAAKFFGFWYHSANGNFRGLSVQKSPAAPTVSNARQAQWPQGGETDLQFRVAALLPYSSARGMMSLLMEDLSVPESNPRHFMLLAKGADNAIDEKLRVLPDSAAARNTEQQAEYENRLATGEHIKEFGSAGLRAMAFAVRFIPTQEAHTWLQRWSDARTSGSDSQKRQAMAEAMSALERDMTLQGATAIEDQLQENVAETIATLSNAGIKIYMLTGDKEETAINIGFGVNMLTKAYTQHVITLGEFQRDGLVPEDVTNLKDFVANGGFTGKDLVCQRINMLRLQLQRSVDPVPQALIVDKDALAILLGGEQSREDLLFVTEKCTSVICCRCRPAQKRDMLKLIQDGIPGAKCLAVGDGANDVEMINAANVGVGILGAEGAGAANASDIKVPQFKVLQKLLLVHGRWNYIRMALLVCYMFYKNCLFAQSQWWYVLFTGWSGQKFFIELATQTYNLFYTGIPILLIAVLDQDVDADSAQRFPHLYRTSQRGERLGVAVFGLWILSALWESIVLFFGTDFLYSGGISSIEGASPSVFMLGTLIYSGVIIGVSARLALHTASHNWLYQLLLAACALFWIPTAYVYGALDSDGFLGGVALTFHDANFFFGLPLLLALSMFPTVLFLLYRWYVTPTYQHRVRYSQVVLRKGRHAGFESTPACQQGSNACMAPADKDAQWKDIEDNLLVLGLESNVDEQLDAAAEDLKAYNKQLLPKLRANKLKLKQTGDLMGVDVEALLEPAEMTSVQRAGLREALLRSQKNVMVQFGKLHDKWRQDAAGIEVSLPSTGSGGAAASIVQVKSATTDDAPVQRRRTVARYTKTQGDLPSSAFVRGSTRTDFAHDGETSLEASDAIARENSRWLKYGRLMPKLVRVATLPGTGTHGSSVHDRGGRAARMAAGGSGSGSGVSVTAPNPLR